jgi:hypothetical protein
VQISGRVKWAVVLVALALGAVVAFPELLGAATPSDDRAQFVTGNATTCAAVGFRVIDSGGLRFELGRW